MSSLIPRSLRSRRVVRASLLGAFLLHAVAIDARATATHAVQLAEGDSARPAAEVRAEHVSSSSLPALLRATSEHPFVDVASDGTVWVRGRTYKASFASGRATYVPFLGSRAPRNFPVELEVRSVRVDGAELAFERDVQARRQGDAIEFDRGAFREVYLLGPDTIEQTFVFEDGPCAGALELEIGVRTELAGVADEHGHRFENALGHVRYGRAFVLDRRAAPEAIETRLEGGALRLVVPADFVERAAGALVVDPVLSTFAVETDALGELHPDTSFDATNGVWVTVCEEVFSAADHDVHARRHSTAGVITSSVYVDSSSANWTAPAIANCNEANQFLVVAEVGAAPNRSIRGRTVSAAAGLAMSAAFTIDDPASSGDVYAPDVGGNPNVDGSSDRYCVVWERERVPGTDTDIHARLVTSAATLVGAGTLLVDNSAGTLHGKPAISNSCGIHFASIGASWNVVFERTESATEHDVLGARVGVDGTLVDGTFTVAASVLDERNPTCTGVLGESGVQRVWMAAYQVDGGANGWDVRCRSFEDTSSISTFDLSEQFASNHLDQITPVCDASTSQFVVVYDQRPFPVFLSTDLVVTTLTSIQGVLGVNEGNVSVAPGIHTDLTPRIATLFSSGNYSDDALVVFARDDGGPDDVYATAYDLPSGGPITAYCFGDGSGTACPCGNTGAAGRGCANSVEASGALLSATGLAMTVPSSLSLHATGLPPSSPCLFFQGTSQSGAGGLGTVFGDGLRCAAGVVLRLGTEAAVAGSASYPGPGDPDLLTRGAIPAPGAVRNYQGWYRNAVSFCTPSGFNLTNGLRVVWIAP